MKHTYETRYDLPKDARPKIVTVNQAGEIVDVEVAKECYRRAESVAHQLKHSRLSTLENKTWRVILHVPTHWKPRRVKPISIGGWLESVPQ